jgi:hypothetical protein
MSPEAQFVWFGLGVVLLIIAAVMRFVNKAWDAAFVASALACGFIVFFWNAKEAM